MTFTLTSESNSNCLTTQVLAWNLRDQRRNPHTNTEILHSARRVKREENKVSANNILERKRIDKHRKCMCTGEAVQKKTSKITGKIAINGWREETTPKEGLSVYECASVCDRVQNIITTQQWKIATAKKSVSQNKGKKPNKKRRALSPKLQNTETELQIRSQKSIQKWSTVKTKVFL